MDARQPLYRMKADFFKTLGHPVRIRVLELLSERDQAVSEMLPEVGIEAANLSQQLAVLRRAGLVTARREGLSVLYTLTSPGRPAAGDRTHHLDRSGSRSGRMARRRRSGPRGSRGGDAGPALAGGVGASPASASNCLFS